MCLSPLQCGKEGKSFILYPGPLGEERDHNSHVDIYGHLRPGYINGLFL